MHGSIDRSVKLGYMYSRNFIISFLVKFLMNSNDEKDRYSGSTAKKKFKYILERICGQT
jgi:hypothetical protein